MYNLARHRIRICRKGCEKLTIIHPPINQASALLRSQPVSLDATHSAYKRLIRVLRCTAVTKSLNLSSASSNSRLSSFGSKCRHNLPVANEKTFQIASRFRNKISHVCWQMNRFQSIGWGCRSASNDHLRSPTGTQRVQAEFLLTYMYTHTVQVIRQ